VDVFEARCKLHIEPDPISSYSKQRPLCFSIDMRNCGIKI